MPQTLIDNTIYISLRLIRKYLFTTGFLNRRGNLIPFFKNNMNQISPVPIVDLLYSFCNQIGITPSGRNILEIGIGETNSTGYEMLARGIGYYWGFEPFLPLDRSKDMAMWKAVHKRHPSLEENVLKNMARVKSLSFIENETVDIIFSHCVLEHVRDMGSLISETGRVLKNEGCMLHFVDYRDHFFRYPYHFLQFSEKTWDTFLDPGYLPRYRVSDHVDGFLKAGFTVTVLARDTHPSAFERIKDRIHPSFRRYEQEDLTTTTAMLHVKKKHTEEDTYDQRCYS
jgi:SAM-dependent methyltransferase